MLRLLRLRIVSFPVRVVFPTQGETVLIASEEITAPDSDLGVRWSTRAGSALSSQKFSKAAFRRLAAAFRAALTSAVAAALSRRGFTAELIELLNEGGAAGTGSGHCIEIFAMIA
jgi:hypothetical protein